MKKALLIQPGKMGDLFLVTPIAKFYNNMGYQVEIPVFSNFKTFFDKISYVKAIDFGISLDEIEYHNSNRMKFWEMGKTFEQQISQEKKIDGFEKSFLLFQKINELKKSGNYDLILDPCWGFAGHELNNNTNIKIKEAYENNKKWIKLKYDLCNVPYEQRYNFTWERDTSKEEELLNFIKNFAKKKYGNEEYSIVHNYHGSNNKILTEIKNPIKFSYIKGFEVYDWIKVLENSKNIVCIDSCLCHFVETQNSLENIRKIYLGSEERHWHHFMFNILKNNWENYSSSNID